MISLIHATRWRPEQAKKVRALWLEKSADASAVEHWFAMDADDPESITGLKDFPHVVVNPGRSCVAAWNAAAAASRGDVLVQLSDDWVPPQNWDREILRRLGDVHESKVLAVSDGHRHDHLLCMAILTRKRYVEQGWMFYPEYVGLFSDNEFTYRAYRDGIVVDARDLVFEHRHPLHISEIPVDRTYRHQNSSENQRKGLEIFQRRNPEGMAYVEKETEKALAYPLPQILTTLRDRVRKNRGQP